MIRQPSTNPLPHATLSRSVALVLVGFLISGLFWVEPAIGSRGQFEKAKALYDDIQIEEAEEILKKIIRTSSDKKLAADAHMLMGLIEGLVNGDIQNASTEFLSALFLNPDVQADPLRTPPQLMEEIEKLKPLLDMKEDKLLQEGLDQFDNLGYSRARTLFRRVEDIGENPQNKANALKYIALTYLIIEKDYTEADAEFKKAMNEDQNVQIDQDRTPPHLAKTFELVQREYKLQLTQAREQEQKRAAEARIKEMEANLKKQREEVMAMQETEAQKEQMAKLKEKESQLASLINEQEKEKKKLAEKEAAYKEQLDQLKQQQGEQQALLDEYKSIFGSGATAEQAAFAPLEKNQYGFYEHSFKNGHVMIFVPGGKFQMGADGGAADESPVHEVYLDGYWIDKHEITNKQFMAFVNETKYKTVAEKAGWGGVFKEGSWKRVEGTHWKNPTGPGSSIQGKENMPVVQLTWEDASAYSKWIEMRLPTEAEYENALQGKLESGNLGNINESKISLYSILKPAGQETDTSYYKNQYGITNLMGNVWEWVHDKYDEGYYQQKEGYNPTGPSEGSFPLQAVRGGYQVPSKGVRLTQRNKGLAQVRQASLGFRCAVSFQGE